MSLILKSFKYKIEKNYKEQVCVLYLLQSTPARFAPFAFVNQASKVDLISGMLL